MRALPGDELYYVLHELGLAEGGGRCSPAATAEQLARSCWTSRSGSATSIDARTRWRNGWRRSAHAPPERIGRWLAGMDASWSRLILRAGARIYDLTQGEPPEEPEGTFYPTPDGFFVLDVVGSAPARTTAPDDGGDRAGRGDHPPGRFALPRRQGPRAPAAGRRARRARRGAGGDRRTAGARRAWPTSASPTTTRRWRSTASSTRPACASARRAAPLRATVDAARARRRRAARPHGAGRAPRRHGRLAVRARRAEARRRRRDGRAALRAGRADQPRAGRRSRRARRRRRGRGDAASAWPRRWTSRSNGWRPATTSAGRRRCARSRWCGCFALGVR